MRIGPLCAKAFYKLLDSNLIRSVSVNMNVVAAEATLCGTIRVNMHGYNHNIRGTINDMWEALEKVGGHIRLRSIGETAIVFECTGVPTDHIDSCILSSYVLTGKYPLVIGRWNGK